MPQRVSLKMQISSSSFSIVILQNHTSIGLLNSLNNSKRKIQKMEEQQEHIKTNVQTFSCLNQQNVIVKNNKKIKVLSSDLTHYIHKQFGFIDPDFPHVLSSITGTQTESQDNTNIQWVPAQKIVQNTNYAKSLTSIEPHLFSKTSLTHALTFINWFASDQCPDLFSRDISQQHLYRFDVMMDGIFMNIAIDSYIPVSSKTKKEVFTKNQDGSIFPCLYQKLMAKLYGDYSSITSQFIDIVEMQSFFCRQEQSVTQGITAKQMQKVIRKKISENSMVGFRTRNSIRLQSFGMQSNHIYIILRVIDKEEGNIIQFLELQGERWIGKMSKLRSCWKIQDPSFIEQNKIFLDKEYKQNYMSISDLKGISRQLVILNNTSQYHKNYQQCNSNPSNLTMYRFKLEQKNDIMLRVNYKHKKCYNSIIIVQHYTQSSKNIRDQSSQYRLVKSCFFENKSSNYCEFTLEAGQYFAIVYNSHPQEHNLNYNITIFSSYNFIELVPFNIKSDILHVLQTTFKHHFQKNYVFEGQQVFFKHLYSQTGLALIYVKPKKSSIQLTIDNKKLIDSKIYALNKQKMKKQEQYHSIKIAKGEEQIIIFRCLWSRKENIAFDFQSKKEIQKIVFPPVGSITASQKHSL